MDPSYKPAKPIARPGRLLCPEPLGARWLLNAAGAARRPRRSRGGSGGSSARERWARRKMTGTSRSPRQSCPRVLAGFNAAFPNATMTEVERQAADGETEFGVNAESTGVGSTSRSHQTARSSRLKLSSPPPICLPPSSTS